MNEVRTHVFVTGRVQDVFFRVNTVERAQELEVTGWVKNLLDGRVEAVFEGSKENVEKIVEWTKTGPLDAGVENVEIHQEKYSGEFDDFKIKYN